METVEIGLFKDVNLLYSYVNRVEEARGLTQEVKGGGGNITRGGVGSRIPCEK